jgi:hypothetical protein
VLCFLSRPPCQRLRLGVSGRWLIEWAVWTLGGRCRRCCCLTRRPTRCCASPSAREVSIVMAPLAEAPCTDSDAEYLHQLDSLTQGGDSVRRVHHLLAHLLQLLPPALSSRLRVVPPQPEVPPPTTDECVPGRELVNQHSRRRSWWQVTAYRHVWLQRARSGGSICLKATSITCVQRSQ